MAFHPPIQENLLNGTELSAIALDKLRLCYRLPSRIYWQPKCQSCSPPGLVLSWLQRDNETFRHFLCHTHVYRFLAFPLAILPYACNLSPQALIPERLSSSPSIATMPLGLFKPDRLSSSTACTGPSRTGAVFPKRLLRQQGARCSPWTCETTARALMYQGLPTRIMHRM